MMQLRRYTIIIIMKVRQVDREIHQAVHQDHIHQNIQHRSEQSATVPGEPHKSQR